MKEPIFLEAVLQTKIWGGTQLRDLFNMTLPNDTIGESWSISAHPGGVSKVLFPESLKGMPLDTLYHQRPDLFGMEKCPVFPLLVKILDASQDLSVQVHPDDAYGMAHEGELGKTECWYIIDAKENSKIIYGHNALTKEQFANMVENQAWGELLREVPVKAGDFFYVPHGTIHAIGEGIVILETQQNSDTTYRVYDYDRVGDDGNPRPLHIQQSIDVTQFPHQDPQLTEEVSVQDGGNVRRYLSNDYFTVYKWTVNSQLNVALQGKYTLATVIEGSGELMIDDNTYPVHKGESFILPHDIRQITLRGALELIVSHT